MFKFLLVLALLLPPVAWSKPLTDVSVGWTLFSSPKLSTLLPAGTTTPDTLGLSDFASMLLDVVTRLNLRAAAATDTNGAGLRFGAAFQATYLYDLHVGRSPFNVGFSAYSMGPSIWWSPMNSQFFFQTMGGLSRLSRKVGDIEDFKLGWMVEGAAGITIGPKAFEGLGVSFAYQIHNADGFQRLDVGIIRLHKFY